MDLSKFNGLCEKCRERKGCKAPCGAVEVILQEDCGYLKEVLESSFTKLYGDSGKEYSLTPFSTATESPFSNFNPKLNQTRIFFNRFFLQQPFEQIADDFDVSVSTVKTQYYKASERIEKAIRALDEKDQSIKRYNQAVKARKKFFGTLTKGQKYFIMYSVCGLTTPEIAQLEGAKESTVYVLIQNVADLIKTGKSTFLNPTSEQIKQSQARINNRIVKDRKRRKGRRSEVQKRI